MANVEIFASYKKKDRTKMNLPVPLLVTALPPYSQNLFNPPPFTNQHKFSGVVNMCKIHVLDEPFFCLATVAMIAENVTFSSFHCNYFNDTLFAYQVISKFQCEFQKAYSAGDF